jgi:hypothetical protein
MVITPLALLLGFAQRSNDQYTLGYSSDTFVVRKGAVKESVPLAPPEQRERAVSFRRNKRWAVWDERGLSTRDDDWTFSDRLEAVSVSPRILKKAEILATLAQVKTGKRTREATALSGSRIIGSMVYLLPRWEDADGKPWLEALVAVDLSQPHPKPKLLGSFAGISLSREEKGDRLGIEGGQLTVAVNTGSAWGMASFDPKAGRFGFKSCGVKLLAFEPDGPMIEGTSYGTTLAGRWDGTRTIPWLETRGPAEFIPGPGPILVRTGDRLRSAVTGAELKLATDAVVRRSRYGVVIFWPETNPRSARLVEPNRLEELARWEQGTK